MTVCKNHHMTIFFNISLIHFKLTYISLLFTYYIVKRIPMTSLACKNHHMKTYFQLFVFSVCVWEQRSRMSVVRFWLGNTISTHSGVHLCHREGNIKMYASRGLLGYRDSVCVCVAVTLLCSPIYVQIYLSFSLSLFSLFPPPSLSAAMVK